MNQFDLGVFKQRLEKSFQVILGDVATIRTGRANPSLVEETKCKVYGGQILTLKELASISTQDPQTLTVTPWDQSILEEIYRSLMSANLGLTPVKEANLIRLKIPSLTTERRQEFIKLLKNKLEAGRVMMRQVRRDFMVDIKKAFEDKQLNEDEKFRLEEEVQKIVDEWIGKVDELGARKEAELLQV